MYNTPIMLHAQIREEIKTALRAHQALRLEVLRGILTAFTNELVATRRTPQETLEDTGCVQVLKRLVKQRKDSAQQFTAGGRPELAQKEEDELVIIEEFLPASMSREEIRKIAEMMMVEMAITAEGGSPGAANPAALRGKFIGAVMKACGGNADGNDVKAIAEELLA